MNFANASLFLDYGGPRFGQDEIMVAEHPALGALVEYLVANALEAVTVSRGRPTPVLVAGVERRCAIGTSPSVAEGRPEGLYGNLFHLAPPETVRRAVTVLDPPTRSNIIALSAPSGGIGPYTMEQIELILLTAYTGFRAVVLETASLWNAGTPAVIHTGFWGCGAFGGNRELMTMVQIFAAHLAEADHVVFHAADGEGMEDANRAIARLQELMRKADGGTRRLMERIHRDGYHWSVGDGS